MTALIIMIAINSLALITVSKLFEGIEVKGLGSLTVSALIIGIVNAFIKPVILILTLPFNILTLGLLTLFINGFLFYMVSKLVKGFKIKSYGKAFWGAIVFSIVSILLSRLIYS